MAPQEAAVGAQLMRLLLGSQEPVPSFGLTSGTIHFDPQPVSQTHLISSAAKDRMCKVRIEAMAVSLGDLETYSEALRKSRASGLAEGIAWDSLRLGHSEYQVKNLSGTVTLERYEIDDIRAVYSPNAAIVYRIEGNILSAFVVHARKAPEQLAA